MKEFNNRDQLNMMIRRYVAGKANEREKKFVEAYYEYFENQDDIFSQLGEKEKAQIDLQFHKALLGQSLLKSSTKLIWSSIIRISVAASIILVISTSLYFYLNRSDNQKVIVMRAPARLGNDIAPGGNIAMLTLADGTKINLDDAANGNIAEQAGIKISKPGDGQLVYTISQTDQQAVKLSNVINTIETPRGGEYQVNLPDGTRVWLNAASSLRYPASFAGKDRKVELDGEAYFEVAPDKTKPFIVKTNLQEVEVLGTHFNINSYEDEGSVKTTLLEGSIKVSFPKGRSSQILKPGQQAVVKLSDKSLRIKNVDVEESIAWKNGYFIFNNENIQSIMRKVSRWYNVDVEYRGNISKGGFGGNVSKTKNISEVLRILELTEAVHFKVEGRRVTVMP